MAKIKGRIVGSVKRKPKKVGANRPHGGFPTQKVVAIRAKILSDIKKKD